MSNTLYNKFCLATFPDNLTLLDLNLLGHYCLRFNKTLKPPRAFPGMPELMRITKTSSRSNLRSRARLVEQGYLYKITKGRPGTNSEFGVNRVLIEKLIQVTYGSPIINECPEGDELLTVKAAIDDWAVSNGSPLSHPISKESNKSKESKTFDLVRFNDLIVQALPRHLQSTITPGKTLEERLDKLKRQGITSEAVYSLLNNHNWNGAKTAYPLILKLLDELLAINEASCKRARAEKERARLQKEEQEEHDRSIATPVQVSRHVAAIRAALRENQVKSRSC